ncbi:Xaa-Pro peptidase family protein [Gordonia sp. (in: high G+C Gram-positive bacteria)]|uniref:M24 family metallopeptidase n=1 Tax=Gordonia sp. (in: high G+C Gram-positive bacteria) TaxID=84139 RepID=UPI0016AD8C95|nr:Xaa-Pro peptidase family protein [Gordonia sp. (in: high G+C Gram-positive bacteria)]NLG47711.1 aminopeptidase P family protein [Gordonia sp. (in: high G+C Gram-positive bacteria)]
MATRFSSDVYARRLQRAAELTRDAGFDAIVVGTGPDFRYLTGSDAETFERLTALVIPASGAVRVVTARLELASLRESAIGDLGLEVADWVDGDDPYALALAGLGDDAKLAVSDALPALHLVPLGDRTSVAPQLATPVLRELRMIKDDAELAALRRAGAAIDRVHARMGEFLKPGRTEAAVAADIDAAIRAEGHDLAEFIIVGSGPNGADPHHEHSAREIQADDIVVIDIGGPVHPGYNSDSTRTYCFAAPRPDIAEAYAALERAQAAAVAAVRPGATAESIDAAAREILVDAGLGDKFIHRTGHGIGLSVHEEPYIVAGNHDVLREGMAFSVEPGVYFAGDWGARIEDIVIVTSDGCEPVNTRPHHLVILPG